MGKYTIYHIKFKSGENEPYKDELINLNIDENDKYYSHFMKYYNIGYNKYDPSRTFIYNIPVFKEFKKIYSKKCIPNTLKNNCEYQIYDDKYKSEHNNLDILSFKSNQLTLYKVMDGFYDIDSEQQFINNNRNVPIWVSSPWGAFINTSVRAGGINAYKNTKKNCNLIIINCKNILNLQKYIAKLPDTVTIRVNKDIRKLKRKYIHDLFGLAACTTTDYNKSFRDQLNIYKQITGYDEIWLADNQHTGKASFCDGDIVKGDYFGIVFRKGYHNYNFAYLLQLINKQFLDNYFTGYIVRNKYSPFFVKTGNIAEEIILFDYSDTFTRDINNKYDWLTYRDSLQDIIPKKLKLQYLLSLYNLQYDLYRMYNISYKNAKIPGNGWTVLLNCNQFKSINQYDKIADNLEYLLSFIKFFDKKVDCFILFNCGHTIISGAIMKYNCQIICKNNDIPHILLYNYTNNKLKYNYKMPDKYSKYRKIADNIYNDFTYNFTKIYDKSADILLLQDTNDSYFTHESAELQFIKDNTGLKMLDVVTSFYRTDNFYFMKKMPKKYLVCPYQHSYYYPIFLKL